MTRRTGESYLLVLKIQFYFSFTPNSSSIMDANDTLKKSDWIAQGKACAFVPPRVKKMAAEFFTIPQEVEYELLPTPYLSIAKMLEFPRPLQNVAAPTGPQPAQFFSTTAPDINDATLLLRVRRLTIVYDDCESLSTSSISIGTRYYIRELAQRRNPVRVRAPGDDGRVGCSTARRMSVSRSGESSGIGRAWVVGGKWAPASSTGDSGGRVFREAMTGAVGGGFKGGRRSRGGRLEAGYTMVRGSTRWETAAQRAAGAGGGTGEPCGAVGGNGESTESGGAAQGDEDGVETAAAAAEDMPAWGSMWAGLLNKRHECRAVGSDGDKKYVKGGSDDEKTINGERQRHRLRMAAALHIVLPSEETKRHRFEQKSVAVFSDVLYSATRPRSTSTRGAGGRAEDASAGPARRRRHELSTKWHGRGRRFHPLPG
ncbi:hypothetical protein C8R44DRAFT_954969 [Mycena epipterygia]|nr:hypothetical protein C8R44DRAFT_954969 [Mycena epipterygia]